MYRWEVVDCVYEIISRISDTIFFLSRWVGNRGWQLKVSCSLSYFHSSFSLVGNDLWRAVDIDPHCAGVCMYRCQCGEGESAACFRFPHEKSALTVAQLSPFSYGPVLKYSTCIFTLSSRGKLQSLCCLVYWIYWYRGRARVHELTSHAIKFPPCWIYFPLIKFTACRPIGTGLPVSFWRSDYCRSIFWECVRGPATIVTHSMACPAESIYHMS